MNPRDYLIPLPGVQAPPLDQQRVPGAVQSYPPLPQWQDAFQSRFGQPPSPHREPTPEQAQWLDHYFRYMGDPAKSPFGDGGPASKTPKEGVQPGFGDPNAYYTAPRPWAEPNGYGAGSG